MKRMKRIFMIVLSVFLIISQTVLFSSPPLTVNAQESQSSAIALPVAELAALLWNLLMTAGVGIGAYGIMDNYTSQEKLYDDFLNSLGDGTITIPDGEITIHGPHSGESYWDLGQLEGLDNLLNWSPEPPKPEEPPEPDKPPEPPKVPQDDYWQQLGKQSSFKVNGAFLGAISEYFYNLLNSDSELKKELFPENTAVGTGWSGEAKKDSNGKYVLEGRVNVIDSNADFLYVFNTISSNKPVGIFSNNGVSLHLQMYHLNQNNLMSLYARTNCYVIDYKIDSDYRFLRWQDSYWFSTNSKQDLVYSVNFPVFSNTIDALNYLKTGNDEACLNRMKKQIDYKAAVNKLPQTLKPLLKPDTYFSAKSLADTMIKTKTQIETQPEMDTETYTEQFTKTLTETLVEVKPEYKPAPAPAYPDTDTETGTGTAGEGLTRDWKMVFPFCIPFDMIDLIRAFEAEPKAPYFEIPIKSELFQFEYMIEIDLKDFDEIARIFRLGETALFLIGLALVTGKVIKW